MKAWLGVLLAIHTTTAFVTPPLTSLRNEKHAPQVGMMARTTPNRQVKRAVPRGTKAATTRKKLVANNAAKQRAEAAAKNAAAARKASERKAAAAKTIAERKAFNYAGQRNADPVGGEPAKCAGRRRVPVPGESDHPAEALLYAPVGELISAPLTAQSKLPSSQSEL